MNNKNNIFFFATKELTQDAFLRWMFENFDDKDLESAVRTMLESICGLEADENIQTVSTTAQWHHIDVSLWIKTNKRKIAIFIEDKTYTSEHWQLKTYNAFIQKCTEEYGRNIYPIYYKLGFIDDDEMKRIEDARTEMFKWEVYDTNHIFALLKKFEFSNNLLLRQYVEYISAIHQAMYEPIKPMRNDSKIDLLQWQAYFDRIIIPRLNGNGKEFWCGSWKAGQFPYVCFHVEKIDNSRVPYLEIASKDCINNQFVASILTYGVDVERIKMNEEFIARIQNDSEMSKFRHTKEKKTLAKSTTIEHIETTADYIEITERYIDKYLEFMRLWK